MSGNADGGSHTYGANNGNGGGHNGSAAISSQLHLASGLPSLTGVTNRLSSGGGGGGGNAAAVGPASGAGAPGTATEVTDAMVAAVAAAASAAAAAAAAAVVAAAGQQVQAHMQWHPPAGFPFFGIPPGLLAQMAALNMPGALETSSPQLPVLTPALGGGGAFEAFRPIDSAPALPPLQPHSAPPPVRPAAGAAGAAAGAGPAPGAGSLAEATATTDGFHVSAAAGAAGACSSDGDSACSRETANPDMQADAEQLAVGPLDAAWQGGLAPGQQLAWQLGTAGALPWALQPGWAGGGAVGAAAPAPHDASALAAAANPFLLISECASLAASCSVAYALVLAALPCCTAQLACHRPPTSHWQPAHYDVRPPNLCPLCPPAALPAGIMENAARMTMSQQQQPPLSAGGGSGGKASGGSAGVRAAAAAGCQGRGLAQSDHSGSSGKPTRGSAGRAARAAGAVPRPPMPADQQEGQGFSEGDPHQAAPAAQVGGGQAEGWCCRLALRVRCAARLPPYKLGAAC